MEAHVRTVDLVTLVLVIVGGVNWGLVGIFDFDLVKAILGHGAAQVAEPSALSRLIYIVVALSALWQIRVLVNLSSAPSGATTTTTTH